MAKVARKLIVYFFLAFIFWGFFEIIAQEDDLAGIPQTSVEIAEITNLESINTPYVEYTPFITPDEKYLFFESNRPGGVGESGDFDIWYSVNSATEGGKPNFSVPVNPGEPLNSASFDGLPSLRLLPDGTYEIYFTSFASEKRPGPGETNIYYSRQNKDGSWQIPQLVEEISTDFHDRMPSISPDGNYLFFSSNRPGGYGKDDIWVSEYDHVQKKWGKPVNLGPSINTVASEVSPSIHSDGISFYFSSDRRGGLGGYDIYYSQIVQTPQGKTFKRAKNLGIPYNSPQDDEYPTLIRNGNYLYFASNRAGGKGNFDIYRARVPEFARPQVVITMKGRVHEKDTLKGIEANIRIDSIEGPRNISTGLPDGNYSIDFINHRQYKLTISAPGYETLETEIDLREEHEPKTFARNFALNRVFLLPETLEIAVEFTNRKTNTILKPLATYRIIPSMFQEQIIPYFGDLAIVNYPVPGDIKKEEDFLKLLSQNRLEISAKMANYQDFRAEYSFTDIIKTEKRPIEKRHLLKIALEPIEQVTKETPKEGKITVVLEKKGDLLGVVYFELNVGNRLDEENAAKLKKLVSELKQANVPGIILHGHTDSTGTRRRNIVLSRERAMFVKEKLVEAGFPKEKIQPNWHANDRPAVEEKDAESRAKNRRVEIVISKTPLDNVKKDESKGESNTLE